MALRLCWCRVASLAVARWKQGHQQQCSLRLLGTASVCKRIRTTSPPYRMGMGVMSMSPDTKQTNGNSSSSAGDEVPWTEIEEHLKKLSPTSPPDPRDVVSNVSTNDGTRGHWGVGLEEEERAKNATDVANGDQLPIIHVKATYNNTLFTITDHTGRVLAWTSAGAEGFKNARKGTTFAAQSAGLAAAKKAQKLGITMVDVKLKGPGPGRQSALKGLDMGAMKVVSIQDVTPIPHNGCRPRKARRL